MKDPTIENLVRREREVTAQMQKKQMTFEEIRAHIRRGELSANTIFYYRDKKTGSVSVAPITDVIP